MSLSNLTTSNPATAYRERINQLVTLAEATAALVSPGLLVATARSTAPTGWLLCDGSAVSRTTYADLFGAIGTTYGAGDGSTTFNLPDLRGRVPVGVDGAAGRLDANDALGNTGGAQKHTLTTSEIAAHDHTLYVEDPGSGPERVVVAGTPGTAYFESTPTAGTGSTGGGGAHNNMQPYQVVNWLVKT